jgi:aspartyl-tRNA(Asn)/glutamyl-tRNA(Gln) amidotransferase subunit A
LAHSTPDFKGAIPIPIALKDNLNVKGEEITCASKVLKGYKAPMMLM